MSVSVAAEALVAWHDAECGGYDADLPLWRELAGSGSVLDIGAGTGRVALDLAGAGARVTALDREPVFLRELERRAAAAGLRVRTVVADAAGFTAPGAPFDAILVPMQTVQLLADASARGGLLASARRHLALGGILALAIAEELEAFDPRSAPLPTPDVLERDGRRFESQPVAVRDVRGGSQIERIRRIDGGAPELDVIVLAPLDAAQLEAEGEAAGLRPLPRRTVGATDEHVGSTVVVLGG
jgi:SAM-dependent methyltransferase